MASVPIRQLLDLDHLCRLVAGGTAVAAPARLAVVADERFAPRALPKWAHRWRTLGCGLGVAGQFFGHGSSGGLWRRAQHMNTNGDIAATA